MRLMPSMAWVAALARAGVRVGDEVVEAGRHDLPRDTEPVPEPAAHRLLAAVDERVPVVVDLGLVAAGDAERDRLRERELGTAVDPAERRAVEG
jgi:hypothetical protein